MYRGKDLGDKEALVRTCLEIIKEGDESSRNDILPHISVVRSPDFVEPLLRLLRSGNRSAREFAAMALGSLGEPSTITPLYEAFMHPATLQGSGSEAVQSAIILALGEVGHQNAVEPLMRIYRLTLPDDEFEAQRRQLVLSALGNLVQQGCPFATGELVQLMKDGVESIRAQAVTELSTAFWHRPNDFPEAILKEFFAMADSELEQERQAALSALSNLADLGCHSAEEFFDEDNEQD